MNFKLITAAVASVAMVALSACGSATDTKPAVSTQRSASAGSSATPGTSATPSASTTPGSRTTSSPTAAPGGSVDGQELATRMVGAMTARQTAHTTVTMDGTRIAEGDLDFSRPPRVALTMSPGGMTIEVVQVGGVTYLKGVPGMTRPWIKLDPKGTGPVAEAMSSMGDLSKTNDPRSIVLLMAGARGRDRGTARVGGASTRLYSFDIGLSAYGRLLSPQVFRSLKGMVSGPITFSFWIGDDNLPRKITTEMKVKGEKQSAAVTYSDWGKPVRIVAPPASQVGKIPGG